MQRITYLDGHRGVAILLVIFYHAYTRWPELVPYGDDYSNFPLFQHGYLGVELFFLISGFVILMTLEKCQSFFDFIYRRWLRLFPAMLICSILIYISSGIFTERPIGTPVYKDLLPGLTFIEPYIWEVVTGISVMNIEDAFWSLYVEFKFYFFAAIIYFILGSRPLVIVTLLAYLSSYILLVLNNSIENSLLNLAYIVSNQIFSFGYFGWFAAGSAYYIFATTKEKKWFWYAAMISIISAITTVQNEIGYFAISDFLATLVICTFFAFSIESNFLQKVLSNHIFLFFGFISYPLYLLHENIMISTIIQINSYFPFIPGLILPIIPVAFISLVAYIVAKYLEKPLKNIILSRFNKSEL